MKVSVACNPFVLRQTPGNRFSHFEATNGRDSWQVLVELVERYFSLAEPDSNRPDGTVLKLQLPSDVVADESIGRFFSGVILLEVGAASLQATFAQRDRAVEGEEPFVQITATSGRKARARAAEIILYNRSCLSEDERTHPADASGERRVEEAEWQIISVNCRETEGAEPLTPMAMARNEAARLGLPEGVGGTPGCYSAEDYMRSILYWSKRAMIAAAPRPLA